MTGLALLAQTNTPTEEVTVHDWQRRDDEARKRFEADTSDHRMTVLHDDGLYRHLRFRSPKGSFYWFDLVTWPGHLTICGDVQTYTFARLDDMFQFFRSDAGRINPDYWAQKLQGPQNYDRDIAKSYSHDLYVKVIEEWRDDQIKTMEDEGDAASIIDTFRREVDEELLSDWSPARDSEYAAFTGMRDFQSCGRTFYDVDYDLREYDWSFLWACWAIVRGIGRYDQAKTPAVAA